MGQRSIRVNELVKREISDILHTRYRQEALGVTIAEVDVAPNLRHARVYYSVLEGEAGTSAWEVERFFAAEGTEIRRQLSKRVILKYLPRLEFIEDDALARGARINALLDEIDDEEDDPNETAATDENEPPDER